MRRILGLAALLIFVSCTAPKPDSAYEQLVLVGTNDVHGYMRTVENKLGNEVVLAGGADWFAGYIRILEKKYGDRLILLDGGDIFQGTLESNPFQGESMIKYYNALPYRAAAIGNHEFDYGPIKRGDKDRKGALKARMREAKFPFLSANTYYRGTKKIWREYNLFPSTSFTAQGIKVGVIGLTTESTTGKTNPMNIKDLEFGDLMTAADREAKKLRAEGSTVVIITMHEGGHQKGSPLAEMLKQLPKGTIDAVVAGHTHERVAEFVEDVPVIQSGTRGFHFGRIDLFVDKKTGLVNPKLTKIHPTQPICGNWLAHSDSCDPRNISKPESELPLRPAMYEGEKVVRDDKITKIIAPYLEHANKIRSERLGFAAAKCTDHPSGETDVGTLFMEAFHHHFPEASVVYLNGGGFRRTIEPGPFTYGDLYEINPFDNLTVEIEITGKDLLKMVRIGVSGAHKIPAIHGIKLTYTKEGVKKDINGDGRIDPWEKDRLASITWDNGAPIFENQKVRLVTSDYLVAGGDYMDQVFSAIPENKKHFNDITQRDVVAEYLRQHPKLPIPLPYKQRISLQR